MKEQFGNRSPCHQKWQRLASCLPNYFLFPSMHNQKTFPAFFTLQWGWWLNNRQCLNVDRNNICHSQAWPINFCHIEFSLATDWVGRTAELKKLQGKRSLGPWMTIWKATHWIPIQIKKILLSQIIEIWRFLLNQVINSNRLPYIITSRCFPTPSTVYTKIHVNSMEKRINIPPCAVKLTLRNTQFVYIPFYPTHSPFLEQLQVDVLIHMCLYHSQRKGTFPGETQMPHRRQNTTMQFALQQENWGHR